MRTGGLALACALVLGCGPNEDPSAWTSSAAGTSKASGDGDSGVSGAEPTSTGGVTGPGACVDLPANVDAGDGGPGCNLFEPGCDVPWPSKECDPFWQDCPDGFKCMPYSGDGSNAWDSLRCRPVVPDAGVAGEPCSVLGSHASGFDTCAKGHVCWNFDPATCTGTCVEQCKGSLDSPTCADPWAVCYVSGSGVLTLCLPSCHPFDRPCPDGELCVPNPQDPNSFTCTVDASGEEGQAFDGCEYANACDPGLLCANPVLAEECDAMAAGCCLPYCDLEAPDCPGMGLECLPWYEEGQAPPGYEDIGLCGLPL